MTRQRREFSAKIRVQAFERASGRCENCGVKLAAGAIQYDHSIPDAMGGEPTLDNCMVLCRACHGSKTSKDDVPAIAKAKRRQARHLGIKKPSAFPCSRNSKWRKKIDGTVVPR